MPGGGGGEMLRFLIIIISLFIHLCHEQELIPEVIPIEGIPFFKIKANQLNLTQQKSNQMLGFEERGKPENPEKNLSEQSREPTNLVRGRF